MLRKLKVLEFSLQDYRGRPVFIAKCEGGEEIPVRDEFKCMIENSHYMAEFEQPVEGMYGIAPTYWVPVDH